MRLIYQCLLCGARREGRVESERSPHDLLFGPDPDVVLQLNIPHPCADGGLGVAQLIGAISD